MTGTNRSCGLIAFSPSWEKRISTRELWKCSKFFLCVVFRESPNPLRIRSFTKHGDYSLRQIRGGRVQKFGGHKAVVRPVPIPNTAVKRSLADGSGCIASARVGSRQSFKQNPGKSSPGFCCQCSIYGIDLSVHTQLSLKFFSSSFVLASTWFSPGFNLAFFQINTQLVAFPCSPIETPLTSSSTFFVLE